MMRDGQALTEARGAPAPTDDGAPPARPGWWRRRWWIAAGAVVLVCAALLAVSVRPDAEPTPRADDVSGIVDRKVDEAIAALQGMPPASVAVYEAIRPPLVVVRSERNGPRGPGSGIGSGVIVNASGDILTSLHVVQDAVSIRVSFSDGTETPASLKSADPDHDIAVLAPARLPQVVVPAVLGGGAKVGDEVFAVGHPLGLVGSFSAGVVSGLDRSFPLPSGKTIGGMIQFDAAVNPGNSGGPLLNREGQVIGIVTGLANPGGDGFIGIGFAVPISTAGGAAGAPAR